MLTSPLFSDSVSIGNSLMTNSGDSMELIKDRPIYFTKYSSLIWALAAFTVYEYMNNSGIQK